MKKIVTTAQDFFNLAVTKAKMQGIVDAEHCSNNVRAYLIDVGNKNNIYRFTALVAIPIRNYYAKVRLHLTQNEFVQLIAESSIDVDNPNANLAFKYILLKMLNDGVTMYRFEDTYEQEESKPSTFVCELYLGDRIMEKHEFATHKECEEFIMDNFKAAILTKIRTKIEDDLNFSTHICRVSTDEFQLYINNGYYSKGVITTKK